MSKNNQPVKMAFLTIVLGLCALLADASQATAVTAANTPGVYVSEISSTPGAIRGLPTAIAAFVGPADAGPLLRPTRITGWADYQAKFGGSLSNASYAARAVKGFVDNGGTECWFVRVGAAAPSQSASVCKQPMPAEFNIFRVVV